LPFSLEGTDVFSALPFDQFFWQKRSRFFFSKSFLSAVYFFLLSPGDGLRPFFPRPLGGPPFPLFPLNKDPPPSPECRPSLFAQADPSFSPHPLYEDWLFSWWIRQLFRWAKPRRALCSSGSTNPCEKHAVAVVKPLQRKSLSPELVVGKLSCDGSLLLLLLLFFFFTVPFRQGYQGLSLFRRPGPFFFMQCPRSFSSTEAKNLFQ